MSDQQKKALAAIYGEKKLPDGSVIYPAQPVGGEGDAALGWPLWINGVNPMLQLAYKVPSLRFGFGTQFMKFFVFNDPEWDYLKYDFANFPARLEARRLDAERHRHRISMRSRSAAASSCCITAGRTLR